LVVVARTLAAGTGFFSFALPDAKPRRTRIALPRSERPSERPVRPLPQGPNDAHKMWERPPGRGAL